MFIPIGKWTSILKMVEIEVFLMKQSVHSFIPLMRINLWCLIIKRKEILRESTFIQIEKWTLILQIVEGDVFPLRPKLQYHLSQWGECVMVPNHERKADYYVNSGLSKSTNEH